MARSSKVNVQQDEVQGEEQPNQSQVYDTSMKELVDRQIEDMVPALLSGRSCGLTKLI